MSAALDRAVRQVVADGLCSGCGACTLLDAGLTMQPSTAGFLRPVRTGPAASGPADVRTFDRTCPGRTVRAQRTPGSRRHDVLGPVAGCWEAWATDPELRRQGSSGGVLSALQAWLVETGQVVASTAAAAAREPRTTVAVTITTRQEALAAAGSRYAPVAVCAQTSALEPGTSTVGKPCEVAALRALVGHGEQSPLLLSFFCAGTPSAHATGQVLAQLGVDADEPLTELWYRGHGWPGRFTARTRSGREVSTSYEESWGSTLGRAVQWRCKICPDGIGESADITAGDLWHADEHGYPVFTESDGVSALVARTPRGLDVVRRAIAAGVIGARPVDPDTVAGVQPLQRARRQTLAGRLAGARLAGARVPRFRGFGLLRLALADLHASVRTARGTFRRVRRGAAREA